MPVRSLPKPPVPVRSASDTNNKTGIKTGYKEETVYAEGGEILALVAQRGGRCPMPGNVQGQVGWGSDQPDPGEDVPAHGRGLELDGL